MKKSAFYLAYVSIAFLLGVACGKSDSGSSSTDGGGITATTPTSCQAGSLYDSRYGCLNQGSCAQGQALYQNQCIVIQVGNIQNPQQQTYPYQTYPQQNYYNGYTFQNGYFVPSYPYYYGWGQNPYYGGYQGGYPGWVFRGGIWIRVY